MKRIAFASEDNEGLNGQVSQHFGRCPYYVIVDVEGTDIVTTDNVANPYHHNHVPGKVPQFISEQGAHTMIAGGIGPRAIDLFAGLGIEVISGVTGNVGNVLQAYLRKEISGVEACQHDHSGGHDH